jgi:hypothetical protein
MTITRDDTTLARKRLKRFKRLKINTTENYRRLRFKRLKRFTVNIAYETLTRFKVHSYISDSELEPEPNFIIMAHNFNNFQNTPAFALGCTISHEGDLNQQSWKNTSTRDMQELPGGCLRVIHRKVPG